MVNPTINEATRWGLNLLALLGGAIALRLGETIFIPTVIAVLLAAMLWPSASWLHHRLHFRWGLACMIVISGLIVLNLLITLCFALSITKIVQNLPRPNDPIGQEQIYEAMRGRIERISPVPLDTNYLPEKADDSRIFQYIRQTLEGPYVTNALLQVAYYGNNWLWHWILIMFIMLFLLLEGRMLSRRVVEIFGPSREAQSMAVDALKDMAHQVRTYLVWRTIVNFGLALLVGLVYYFLGLRQAWTWALLTAILCYIPYLGPIAAGVPPVIDAFISYESPMYAVGIIIFYIGIITLEGYVVVPVVMGRSMELNATTVMLACLFWELVWGTPGLFLAMPLMAAIKAVCYHVPGWRPWANLMGTSDEQSLPLDEDVIPADDKTVEIEASESSIEKREQAMKIKD